MNTFQAQKISTLNQISLRHQWLVHAISRAMHTRAAKILIRNRNTTKLPTLWLKNPVITPKSSWPDLRVLIKNWHKTSTVILYYGGEVRDAEIVIAAPPSPPQKQKTDKNAKAISRYRCQSRQHHQHHTAKLLSKAAEWRAWQPIRFGTQITFSVGIVIAGQPSPYQNL